MKQSKEKLLTKSHVLSNQISQVKILNKRGVFIKKLHPKLLRMKIPLLPLRVKRK